MTTMYRMLESITHPTLGILPRGNAYPGHPDPDDDGLVRIERGDGRAGTVRANAVLAVDRREVVAFGPSVPAPPAEDKGAVYLSGPMTGIPEFNYPAFNRAARILRAMGYRVVNPAEMDAELGIDGLAWQDFLARDLEAILTTPDLNAVVFIDGWRNSRGATLEGYVAQQAGKALYELVEEKGKPALVPVETVSVAYAAQSVVLGARRFAYGHPLDNFLKIAEMWHATISHKLLPGERIDIRDVAMLMQQVKIAREYNSPKEDNQVDICGYALAYEEAKNETVARGGTLDGLLSNNAALLRQHAAMGVDSER